MKCSTLLVPLLLWLDNGILGFRPALLPHPSDAHLRCLSRRDVILSLNLQGPRWTFSKLRLSLDDEESTATEDKIEPEVSESSDIPSASDKDISSFSDLTEVIGAYSIIALGIVLTFGLVLNILGYAYQITSHGIEIDTLEHYRTQRQMEQTVNLMPHRENE